MSLTSKNLTALEGTTFTLPLCVFNNSLNPDIEGFINWGDGTKERITNFNKESNYYYTKLVDKKYTFPGTYNISIEIKRNVRDIFNDGFQNVDYYNMSVYPTTLYYAPSANFLVNNLSQNDRVVNVYLDSSGVPQSFNGKTLRSLIVDNSNTNIGSFNLVYSDLVGGKIEIEIEQNTIDAMTLNTNYYYSILEVTNTTQLSSMILQGIVKKISPSANGITVS